ncbi:MAG: hypothetical protein WDO18_10850 [Acidobacteriota bacterium]
MRQRVVDTLEICYRESGEAIFQSASGDEKLYFNERFECKKCGKQFVAPEPGLFSFNNPQGACQRCQGFGNTIDYDLDLIIPNRSLSIQQGAVDPWTKPQHSWYLTEFRRDAKGKIRFNTPNRGVETRGDGGVEGGHRGLLPGSGKEEVQGPRARVYQPLSRVYAMSGLRRLTPAAGSVVDPGGRQEHGRGGAAEHRAGPRHFSIRWS